MTSPKIDFGGAGAGIWWEEIGRTTLSSAGDTITVSGLTEKKHLKLIVFLEASGSIQPQMTFNNDGATTYGFRRSTNGGAESTSSSIGVIPLTGGAISGDIFATVDLANPVGSGAICISESVSNSSTPERCEVAGRWSNASDQITRIDITNNSTGDFGIGSEVVVLGHN